METASCPPRRGRERVRAARPPRSDPLAFPYARALAGRDPLGRQGTPRRRQPTPRALPRPRRLVDTGRGGVGREQGREPPYACSSELTTERACHSSSRRRATVFCTRRAASTWLRRDLMTRRSCWITSCTGRQRTAFKEAQYLTAILNSPALTQLLAPMQSRGEHNPRDFDMLVWRLPIPLFDANSPQHRQLASSPPKLRPWPRRSTSAASATFQAQRRLSPRGARAARHRSSY